MIKHRDGIEGLGFPRGPSGIVDNPLSSRRRGKTLGWRAAVLRNVMQTISRGIKDDQAAGGKADDRAPDEEPERKWDGEGGRLKENKKEEDSEMLSFKQISEITAKENVHQQTLREYVKEAVTQQLIKDQ